MLRSKHKDDKKFFSTLRPKRVYKVKKNITKLKRKKEIKKL